MLFLAAIPENFHRNACIPLHYCTWLSLQPTNNEFRHKYNTDEEMNIIPCQTQLLCVENTLISGRWLSHNSVGKYRFLNLMSHQQRYQNAKGKQAHTILRDKHWSDLFVKFSIGQPLGRYAVLSVNLKTRSKSQFSQFSKSNMILKHLFNSSLNERTFHIYNLSLKYPPCINHICIKKC